MMNSHNKHCKTLKTILVAVTAIYASHAQSIGLGELEIKSHIGQPLLATMPVYGVMKSSDVDCFQTQSGSDIARLNFSLGTIENEQTVLTVRSNQIITEPVLNLGIRVDCFSLGQIERDYVLLVDPDNDSTTLNNLQDNLTAPALTEANVATNNSSNTPVSNQKSTKSGQIKRDKTKTKRTTKKKPAPTNISFGDYAPLKSSSSGSASQQMTPVTNTNQANSANSKLVISGGTTRNENPRQFRLALDRQLDLNRPAPAIVSTEEAEVLDEVTVMNNRLKDLQTALTDLQRRNIELEAHEKTHALALEASNERAKMMRNFGYGVGALALLLGGFYANSWWRKRQQNLRIRSKDILWASAKENQNNKNAQLLANAENVEIPEPNINNEDSFDFDDSLNPNTPASVEFVSEEEEDILDHADVFLSHGRTKLAIQALESYLEEKPKVSAGAWLLLLDLLAKEGLKDQYEMTRIECRKYFNVAIPDFSQPNGDEEGIESFNRICEQLKTVWGTSEATQFLNELIYNSRLEPRIGFSKAIFEELIVLRNVASEEEKSGQVIDFKQEKNMRNERNLQDEKPLAFNFTDAPILPTLKNGQKDRGESLKDTKLSSVEPLPRLDLTITSDTKSTPNANEPAHENGFSFELDEVKKSAKS